MTMNAKHVTIVIIKTRTITDPDIKCGILIYRHNNQQPLNLRYTDHCNEDVCLIHLKALHGSTTINDLTEWRNNIDYILGVKVGGVNCRLLQIYGTCILLPILLNLTFNIILFINDIRDKKANIFEVIPLVFLVYPQYKTLKFLSRYLFVHRNENVLHQETVENNRTVAPLEPFLESALQVRKYLTFYSLSYLLFNLNFLTLF